MKLKTIAIKILKTMVFLSLVACIVYYFAFYQKDKKVEYTIATRQDVLSSITSTGKVTSDSIVTIKSQLPNLIKSSSLKVGDRFNAGDLLVEFDSSEESNAITQAQQTYKNASNQIAVIDTKDYPEVLEALMQAQLTFANFKYEYEKNLDLYEKGAIPKDTFEKSKYNMAIANSKLTSAENLKNSLSVEGSVYKQALGNIDDAKLSMLKAKDKYNKAFVYAPFDGIILEKHFNDGELSGIGNSLYTIVKIQDYIVRAAVDEKYLSNLFLGQKVSVTLESFKDQTLDSTISKISPLVDKKSGTVEIDIVIGKTPDYLRIDMTANIEIETDTLKDVIVVDKKYLDTKQSPKVWKLVNGIVESTDVEIFKDMGSKAIVSKGVDVEDILLPKDLYKSGAVLKIEN